MGWQAQAACRGVETMWWPEKGLDIVDQFGKRVVDTAALERRYRAQIRMFCRRCPVVDECLADALASNAKYYDILGVRGGLTPRERSSIRYRQKVGA